jgi:hypothetical protein
VAAKTYADVCEARAALQHLTSIEESYFLLRENHLELERSLLDLALKHMLFGGTGWDQFQDDILTANRRVTNLLSAIRAYQDQSLHALSSAFGPTHAVLARVREARARQYDSRQEYRVGEALRNHQQHRGLAVQALSVNVEGTAITSGVGTVHTASAFLSIERLRREGGFKPAVLEELAVSGKDRVPLMPILRGYLEALNDTHLTVRAETHLAAEKWHARIADLIERGRRRFGSKAIGFELVAEDGDGRKATTELFQELLQRRGRLQRKTRSALRLKWHYVSNRADHANEAGEPTAGERQ